MTGFLTDLLELKKERVLSDLEVRRIVLLGFAVSIGLPADYEKIEKYLNK